LNLVALSDTRLGESSRGQLRAALEHSLSPAFSTRVVLSLQGEGNGHQKRAPGMSTEAVFVIIGTVVTVVTSIAGLVWWAYRGGQAAATQRAEDKARIEALQRELKTPAGNLTCSSQGAEGPDRRNQTGSEQRKLSEHPQRQLRGGRWPSRTSILVRDSKCLIAHSCPLSWTGSTYSSAAIRTESSDCRGISTQFRHLMPPTGYQPVADTTGRVITLGARSRS
jgi:hypothetical protein